MSYDGVGRLVETINPVGEITKIDYDAFGNTVVSSNYLGTTQARYDQFDRLVEETDAIGDIRSFDYTNDSQIRETVSGAGASGTSSLVSIVDLDPLGRVVKQSDAAGSSRTIDYDGVGNQIRTVDRRGMIVETVFDARNVPLSITEAAETDIAATTTLEYDNLTRLIKETDPRGEFFAVTYVYDNLGRVIEQHTPTGTPDQQGINTTGFDAAVHQWRYTPTGNLDYEIPAGGEDYRVDYSYDPMDRPSGRSFKAYVGGQYVDASESYVYDTAGRLRESVDAAGYRTLQEFDPIGRITSQSNQIEGIGGLDSTTWAYENNALGTRVEKFGPDGTSVELTQYDQLGRVSEFQTLARQPISYSYDAHGLVETETVGSLTTNYAYDQRGYLTTETDPAGFETSYTFDAEGNMTSRREAGLTERAAVAI